MQIVSYVNSFIILADIHYYYDYYEMLPLNVLKIYLIELLIDNVIMKLL